MICLLDYGVSFLFGGLVGLSELIARYRDEPWEAIKTLASLWYIFINACAATGSLYVAKTFHWTFGMAAGVDDTKLQVIQILAAGFSSMALLRSSLFTVRIGHQDVGIGFNAVIQIFLRATDAAVDRKRGFSKRRWPFFQRTASP